MNSKAVNWLDDSNMLVFDIRKMKGKVMCEPYNQMQLKSIQSDCEEKLEDQVSSSLSVDVGFPGMSASMANEMSEGTTKGKRFVRIDDIVEIPLQKVMFKTNQFHQMVSEEFKEYCLTPHTYKSLVEANAQKEFAENAKHPGGEEITIERARNNAIKKQVQQFRDKVGAFFATELQLGGLIRTTFKMVMTSEDTSSSCFTSVKVTMTEPSTGCSITPSASTDVKKNTSDSTKDIEIACRALGGDVTVFGQKALNEDDKARIQNEWAMTICENAVGFNHQLKPIWELVKHFNQEFAEDIERELKAEAMKHYNFTQSLVFADQVITMKNHEKREDCEKKIEEVLSKIQDLQSKWNAEYKKAVIFVNPLTHIKIGIATCKTAAELFDELKQNLDPFHTEVEYEDKIKKLLITNHSDYTTAIGENQACAKQIHYIVCQALADLLEMLAWEEDDIYEHPYRK